MSKYIEPDEMRQIIRQEAKVNFGTLKRAAYNIGIHPTYFREMLRGAQDISERIANKFGYERRIVYVRKS